MTIPNTSKFKLRKLSTGTYQLRKRIGEGKRIEVTLGTNRRDVAEQRAKVVLGEALAGVAAVAWSEAVEVGFARGGWLYRLLMRARRRCREKGWTLISDVAVRLAATRCGGVCEVSGMKLVLDGAPHNPLQPSIDRIDSSRGYDPDNIRIVCVAVNYCMSEWGERVFKSVAAAVTARELEKLATVEDYSAQSGEKSARKSSNGAKIANEKPGWRNW